MASFLARATLSALRTPSYRCMSSTVRCQPDSHLSRSGHNLEPLAPSKLQELTIQLPEPQRRVLLTMQTEAPYSGTTSNGYRFDSKDNGTYVCAMGGLPVFHSKHKANYGLGYATFWRAIDQEHVSHNLIMMGLPMGPEEWPLTPEVAREHGLSERGGMVYEEVLDTRTGSHLGWMFQVSGRQCYCINASALHFVPDKEEEAIPQTCWSPCETCPHQDSCTHAKKSGCGTLTNIRWRGKNLE